MSFPRRLYLPFCALWVLGFALLALSRANAQACDPTARLDASLANQRGGLDALMLGTPAAAPAAAKAQSLRDKFLAQTKVTLEDQGAEKNVFRFSFLFPTKATAELTITIQANQLYTPTPQESKAGGKGERVYGMKTTRAADGSSYTASFFVPYSSLSPDLVKKIRGLAAGPAPTGDLTDAPHLLLAGYSPAVRNAAGSGIQEVGGALGSNSQGGEEGASATANFVWGAQTVGESYDDIEKWSKAAGRESEAAEALGVTGQLLTGTGNVIEAWMLGEVDSILLAEIAAWQYCAHNMDSLDVNPPGGADHLSPGELDNLQTQVDILANLAPRSVGDQFVWSMLSEANSYTWPFSGLFEEAIASKKQAASQELASLLSDIRNHLLPYCKSVWYGNFHITRTHALAGQTYDTTGDLYFSVNVPFLKGKIENAHVKHSLLASDQKCFGEGTFSATLSGGGLFPMLPTAAGTNRSYVPVVAFTSQTIEPSPPNHDMQCSILSAGEWVNQTMPWPNETWDLTILVGGDFQSTEYDLPLAPDAFAGPPPVPKGVPAGAAAAAKNQGIPDITGHVSIKVKRLK
jgi:hypothetical protein